jgi:hypothetical protein
LPVAAQPFVAGGIGVSGARADYSRVQSLTPIRAANLFRPIEIAVASNLETSSHIATFWWFQCLLFARTVEDYAALVTNEPDPCLVLKRTTFAIRCPTS